MGQLTAGLCAKACAQMPCFIPFHVCPESWIATLARPSDPSPNVYMVVLGNRPYPRCPRNCPKGLDNSESEIHLQLFLLANSWGRTGSAIAVSERPHDHMLRRPPERSYMVWAPRKMGPSSTWTCHLSTVSSFVSTSTANLYGAQPRTVRANEDTQSTQTELA